MLIKKATGKDLAYIIGFIDIDARQLPNFIDMSSDRREYGNRYQEVGWAKGVELISIRCL
jgi:hypothetical protein